jgi:hypothetical protein
MVIHEASIMTTLTLTDTIKAEVLHNLSLTPSIPEFIKPAVRDFIQNACGGHGDALNL